MLHWYDLNNEDHLPGIAIFTTNYYILVQFPKHAISIFISYQQLILLKRTWSSKLQTTLLHLCTVFLNMRLVFISYHQNDWLIIYCFTSHSRIFHLHGDVTIAGEGLQNLGLCSAHRAIEQGGIYIVPHLLWHGTSVFPSHPKDRPI
jgi:hypothetical protein